MKALPDIYEFVTSNFGFGYCEGRTQPDGAVNWMVSLMFFPVWKSFQPFRASEQQRISVLGWMPVDDENAMVWAIEYHPTRPLTKEEMAWSREDLNYIHVETIPGTLRPVRNKDNNYLVVPRPAEDEGLHRHPWPGTAGLGHPGKHGLDRGSHPRAPEPRRPGDHQGAESPAAHAQAARRRPARTERRQLPRARRLLRHAEGHQRARGHAGRREGRDAGVFVSA